MTTTPTVDVYEAALRPRPSRAWVVLCVWAACACVAWLGWCAWQVMAVRACSAAEYTWTGSSCVSPDVQITIKPPARMPAGGLLGPGGA